MALLIFFSIGAALGVLYINDTTSELKRLVELYQVEELRRSLIINIQTVQSNLHTVNTPFAKELDSIVENVITLEQSAAKCSSCHHRRDLSDRIVIMQSIVQDYRKQLSYFLTTRANSKRLLRMKEGAVATGNQLITMAGQMSHSASASLDEKTENAMSNISDVKFILYATIAVTLIFSILVAMRLIQSVIRPVHALLDATRTISSGNYGSAITYTDKTEFGELASHFNSMSAAIREGYDKIKKEVMERRQTEDALRESEEKFRTFFEMSPIGIIIYPVHSSSPLNERLKFSTFNSAFHNLFGYSREELGNKSIAEITCHEDLRKNIRFSNELISGKRESYSMEKRYIHKNGRTIWGYLSVTALRSPAGEFPRIMTTVVDISERKKIEEEQLKTEKLESVGILAGGIAHDFNNMLTTIVNNISLAKMISKRGGNPDQDLSSAEDACHRAKSLTKQLLTFSKGGDPIKKAASIAELLKDSVRFVLSGSNVNCFFEIPDDLWSVEIDEGQINQVIMNLIINATQAMPDGGAIRIGAENVNAGRSTTLPLQGGAYIKISVQDQGIGISQEHIQKIFDPYFTTKQMGSGLGLSSAYSIIKNHNGFIDVESDTGAGSTFHVYLPALRGQRRVRREKEHAVIRGEGKILLMDDDKSILSTVGKTLIKIGYTVGRAKDGVEAIELYKQAMETDQPFDAVILDLTIREGMGGEEAMNELLRIDPEVKAIVSSGYSTDTIMANYREYGFNGVITKPYQVGQLSELLDNVISKTTEPL